MLSDFAFIVSVKSVPCQSVESLPIQCGNVGTCFVNLRYNDMPKVVRVVPQSLMAPDQRKGTISQYFSATNCPVCDKQTNQPICNSCVKDPQHVCVTLCDRIRRWEKVYHDLVQVNSVFINSVKDYS